MITATCDFCGRTVEAVGSLTTHNVHELGGRHACPRCDDLLREMYMRCARRYLDDYEKTREDKQWTQGC